jgi:hypothetical protein
MPTDFRDIKAFMPPADVREIVEYARDGETADERMSRAFDHLDGQLTPKFERALSIDLRLAVDEFVDLMGARPDKTADLEQWQPAFDQHIAAAIGDDTLKLLGEAWSDMVVVNCELDDPDAFERACKTGADAMLDALVGASSKNKMLSAVGIAAGTFTETAATATIDDVDLGDLGASGAGDPALPADPGADDLGLDEPPAPSPFVPASTDPARVARYGKRGRPPLASDALPTNEEALKVLLAVRENAADSDTVLARIFGCSRAQIGNYVKRTSNFVPTSAQVQALRDLAARRAQALSAALRVTGQ